jgi:cytochrome c biogenesis protein CcmG, thiol:disulfide interchange protein DsbE
MSTRRLGPVAAPVPLGLLLALVVLAVVSGCSRGDTPTAPTVAVTAAGNVDVDTAALRRQKDHAGIDDCVPGPGDSVVAGGLPNVILPCLGGGAPVNLSALRGPLVINLFAQWCGPCREELPFYQRLSREGEGKLRVLGIDYLDTQPGGALALAEDTGVTFPLLADPGGVLRNPFKVRGLPGVLFVDAHGRITNDGSRPTFTVIRSYDELTTLVHEQLGIDL